VSRLLAALLVGCSAAAAACSAQAQTCSEPLVSARRLVLVVPANFTTNIASLQRFERASGNAPWQAVGGPETALIGYQGTAWARIFRNFARKNELIKVDGDKRIPAGFFSIGHSFGFVASLRPHYLRVSDGTVCVDDPASPAYNTITSRAKVGWHVHGENMWRVPEYRRGLLVEYPTDAKAHAGSCIFIHTRSPGATGTNGCVSLPEPQIAVLQDFAENGAVLAVVPRPALDRFKGCLPDKP
jgi:L,D-peptidoglycan transpeptidase YkuD (ErfK/YbiS/YcfS/YnhG family)